MSLKKKYLHIIELGFKYLTETEKNYQQINLLKKLDNLGYGVAAATLSKISKKKHVGNTSLEKVANGFQAIIEKELCLRFNEATMQYEQIADCEPTTINEDTYNSQSDNNDDAVTSVKVYPSGRLSISKKVQFMSTAKTEVIELGLRLNNFANYFTNRNADEYKNHIIRLLNTGVDVNCYIADPIAPSTKMYFEDRAKFNSKELKKFRQMSEIIEDLKDTIRTLRAENHKGNMSLYAYTCLPYMHVLAVDGNSKNGKILVSNYMCGILRVDMPVMEIVKAEQPVLFQKYWESSQHIISTSKLIF